MFTSAVDEAPTAAPAQLTAADRCDQCGARAWVRVTMANGELYFCAHHAQRHMEALRASAIDIVDERHLMPV